VVDLRPDESGHNVRHADPVGRPFVAEALGKTTSLVGPELYAMLSPRLLEVLRTWGAPRAPPTGRFPNRSSLDRCVLPGQFFQQFSGGGRASIFGKNAGDALRILAV
jgi:hypothetical protein